MKVENTLDTARLYELYGEDAEYAASMFETFLEEVFPEFNEFNGLMQQQRWEDVRQLAHKLRPTLGMVGLSDLETLLGQFEKLIEVNAKSEQVQQHWHVFSSGLTSRKSLVQAEWQRLLTTNKL